VAVADGAVVFAHDAACAIVAGDACVGEGDATDVAAALAEETLVNVGPVVAGLIDADAADGVALSIEVASEGADLVTEVAADGGVVVLVFVSLLFGVAVGNVGPQHEVLALVAIGGTVVARGVVDALCQQVELFLIIYDVGVGLGARALGGPVDLRPLGSLSVGSLLSLL